MTYEEAVQVTDQLKADECFKELVDELEKRMVENVGELFEQRSEAEDMVRKNLAYFAGYYSSEVRRMVEKLYDCVHPVFGSIEEKGEPTARQSFNLGRLLQKKMSEGSTFESACSFVSDCDWNEIEEQLNE
tara:strand:+ start:133 stop:525 length:393 start_codon:yes stop_codon:yes gene_type:complete